MIIKKKWNAMKRTFSNVAFGVTGKNIPVTDMPIGLQDQVGCADPQKIMLNPFHPLFNKVDEKDLNMIISGIFTHELMHKIMSNFNILEHGIKKYPRCEQPLLAEINNIIEDPAIEFFAPQFLDGWTIESLRFSIAFFYKIAPNIEKSKSAYGQFISACIQFGDMGLIKGQFTFEEAKTTFEKVVPLINKAIEEPKAKKRFEYAEKVFEISRPLWQKEANQNKLMEELAEIMKNHSKSSMSGSGSSSKENPDEDGENGSESKKQKRRNITVKKITKKEAEEMGLDSENASPSEIPEDGDLTVYMIEDEDNETEENEASLNLPAQNEDIENSQDSESDSSSNEQNDADSSDKNDDKTDSSNSSNNKTDESSDSNLSSSSNSKENDDNDEDSQDNTSSDGKSSQKTEDNTNLNDSAGEDTDTNTNLLNSSDNSTVNSSKNTNDNNSEDLQDSDSPDNSENNSDGDINSFNGDLEGNAPRYGDGRAEYTEDDSDSELTEDEFEYSDEDINAIEQDIKRQIECLEIEEANEIDDIDTSSLEVEGIKGNFGNVTCLNRVVKTSSDPRTVDLYNSLVAAMSGGISNLTRQIKRMIITDAEDKERKKSGRININRYYGATVTSRIFDKKVDPKNKSNTSVMILVDESGSMGGYKCKAARECVIALAETFGSLNIPMSVIGFTNGSGYDAVHYHYMHWKNCKKDKYKLLGINAHNSNFDGYSIRYAGALLKKRPEEHKLFIVISDGAPASNKYPSHDSGISDTKAAITEVSKYSTVIGVGIGNSDTELLHTMYGNSFLYIQNTADLFTGIAPVIKKRIQEW